MTFYLFSYHIIFKLRMWSPSLRQIKTAENLQHAVYPGVVSLNMIVKELKNCVTDYPEHE